MSRSTGFSLGSIIAAGVLACCAQSFGAGVTVPTPLQASTISGPFTYSDSMVPAVQFYVIGTTDPNKDTWTAMEAQAQLDGGFLASIHDQAENDFIVNTVLANTASVPTLSDQPVWIGLADPTETPGAALKWADGSTVNYTNWNTATGEPNDDTKDGSNNSNADQNATGKAGEFYTAINWHWSLNNGSAKGTWNDTPDDGTRAFGGNSNGPYYGVIEIPATAPVPLPKSFWMGAVAFGLVGAMTQRRHRRGAAI